MAKKTESVNLKPLDDRLVVSVSDATEKTAGGILLPDTAKNKPQRGKVLAVGPGKLNKKGEHIALDVKVGDTVLFTSWAGDEVKKQYATSDDLLIMREDDVLAVIE
jgi:chaperonin GroES